MADKKTSSRNPSAKDDQEIIAEGLRYRLEFTIMDLNEHNITEEWQNVFEDPNLPETIKTRGTTLFNQICNGKGGVTFQCEQAIEVWDNIDSVYMEAMAYLEELDQQTTPNEDQYATSSEPPRTQETNSSVLSRITLPSTINLKVNPKYDVFEHFWELFKVAVHDQTNISTIEKLYLLLSSLEGEARTVVSSVRSIEENYSAMIELLRKQFGDPIEGAAKLADQLRHIRRATNLTEAIAVAEKIDKILTQEAMLREPTKGQFMTTMAKDKFPGYILTKALESRPTQWKWTATELLGAIRESIIRFQLVIPKWSQYTEAEKRRTKKESFQSAVASFTKTGIYNAMKDYPLKGTKGLVVGSLTPWVEAYCLKCGAEKVITLEYKRIVSEHPKVGYLHPIEMAMEWKKHKGEFDFIASFSSIEHSGLGRYGDALDPNGDLRELQKIRCLLKEGGYLFLGIPTGADGIYYNAHRIYGRARLPMMFDGFKLLNVYYGRQTKPVNLSSEYFEYENYVQYVFALQKVDD